MKPIVLGGPLDQYAAEELKLLVLPLVDKGEDAIFDFSEIDRMHAASLQVLIGLNKALEPKGRRVELQHVESRVRDLFRISGTENFFRFSDGAH